MPSLVSMTFDGFFGVRSVLGSVCVVSEASTSGVITFFDGCKPSKLDWEAGGCVEVVD